MQQLNSNQSKSWNLTSSQICDVELIMNGGFAPLTGFLNQVNYESVCQNMRLASGALWPIPITLDVTDSFAQTIQIGETIALCDKEAKPLALLTVESLWQADKQQEAALVLGTQDVAHPWVNYLLQHTGNYYLGGTIQHLQDVTHYDFRQQRHSPSQLKKIFKQRGWNKVIAFQTRNPIHRAHFELMSQAMEQSGAKLLLHPVVGQTKAADINHQTRVRCYEHIINKFPADSAMLSLLPLAMRMAGPREALWHALIRKNYGATHFIIGRDHAGPGNDSTGAPFYEPLAAQQLVKQHEAELQMQILTFDEFVYVANRGQYLPATATSEHDQILNISGTAFRNMLYNDEPIPAWFSFPEIITELKKTFPAKGQQGFTVFLTGLSGAGKSTIANALLNRLSEQGERRVSLLDGDLVRKNLSSELGFSKEHRDLNILRIGYVASEITKHRGIAICAPIAPYASIRRQVRESVTEYGGFIEVYVATPLAICEQRDTKGLYQKARLGLITNFTGINDPYEEPIAPEVIIDTSLLSVTEAVEQIITKLKQLNYLIEPTTEITETAYSIQPKLIQSQTMATA